MLLSLLLFTVLLVAVFYYRPSLPLGSLAIIVGTIVLTLYCPLMWLALLPTLAIAAVLNLPDLRTRFITKPSYELLRRTMPSISTTEREALEAGTTWWEKELFSGQPNWDMYSDIDLPQLTEKEQQFIDNEVEQLCGLVDEWDIEQRKDLSPEAWDYLRNNGFFGLIIPEEFGGLDFSPYAQSRIMSKIASKSTTTAVTAMVPNSLGPGELLVKYGTKEQKQRWLPGLADGTELPCFGLTGPEAGSDAGSIPDIGLVCKQNVDGKEVLGLKLTFSKRWITLAPVASVIGLAFKLRDPDGLLGDPDIVDYGITCALLPADHPGIEIGRRHNPGAPFMNGPIKGEDVFIPIDWIIGGASMAGKGWRMLIECLGAGRGVSLPSLATAGSEMCYLTVGAFARIRRQFNMEIGKFEGVQAATAEIAAGAYTLEAMRQMVTKGLEGGAPSVLTAMAKYHSTERMREMINHAMDVVGGRAIQLGPRNFLAIIYRTTPVAITVEGANILTRSLMIFGQGSMRCHPMLFDELEALQQEDEQVGLNTFEPLLMAHLGHTSGNIAKTLVYGLSGGLSSPVPHDADDFSTSWYKKINHLSAVLATCSDVALGTLGGGIKRNELLSARLGDIHSEILVASSILKYRNAQQQSEANDAHALYALQRSLNNAQKALLDFCSNFPQRWLGVTLRVLCLPLGRRYKAPDDRQIRLLGKLIMEPNPVREALRQYVFVSDNPEDAVGRVETTYQMLLDVDSSWQAFSRARSKGKLGDASTDLDGALEEAVRQGIIPEADAIPLKEYNQRRYDCVLTDHFEKL